MVDDIKDNKLDNDLEADFPSFLRSDNPDNYDHDINHFLEEDKALDTSEIGTVPETGSTSSWNDGFADEDKHDTDALDLDLGLDAINPADDNFDLPELGGTEDEPWLQSQPQNEAELNPLPQLAENGNNDTPIENDSPIEEVAIEGAIDNETDTSADVLAEADESSVSEAMEEISAQASAEPVNEAVDNLSVDVVSTEPDLNEEDITANMDDTDKYSSTDDEVQPQPMDDSIEESITDSDDANIKFMNDEEDEGKSNSEVPNPEDYMSFDVPLEQLGHQSSNTPSAEIPESEFISDELPAHVHDIPQEPNIDEDTDEPYVEVIPGNYQMHPDEYMSYDLPEGQGFENNSSEDAALVDPLDENLASQDYTSDSTSVDETELTDDTASTTAVSQSEPKVSAVEQAEKETFKMFKWYSGSLNDNYYIFSSEEPSGEFIGTPEQNSIYVKIGTSAYGWNVSFENGTNMNLADVREFQLRNGCLPAQDGAITYGTTVLRFSNVERIVVGSIPEYFHYGYE